MLRDGLVAGAGAAVAILLSPPLLDSVDGQQFRRLSVVMMVATGLFILWRRRLLIWSLIA
jgi:hypothetical protein